MHKTVPGDASAYSSVAYEVLAELEDRVQSVFEAVKKWRGWRLVEDRDVPNESISALIREIYHAVAMYQPHTTEAGFRMFGKLPKNETMLMQALCGHKAEEAEHGIWAREDFQRLGGIALNSHSSAAAFAVAAVWWRIAEVEDALAYLGPEYLFERLTMIVTESLMPMLKARGMNGGGLRFVEEHATEDIKHTVFLKHMILDVVTRYPGSGSGMLRCFDYFAQVYPLPVWDEAFVRAGLADKAS